MSNALKGVLLVGGATLFWSLSGVFIRYVPEIDPWTLNAWRGLSTALSLLVWMVLLHGREVTGHFRRAAPLALVATACFFGIGSSLYIAAMQLASVAAVSCVAATSPLFAAVLARLWLKERTGLKVFIAIIAALAGVAIVALGEAGASLTGLSGALIAVIVALCFAGQSVTLRRYHDVAMEPALIIGGFGIFLVVLLVIGLQPIDGRSLAVIGLMGVFQLALPLVLFMRGARYVPAVQMVLISLADAILNPLWVFLVHGEVPAGSVYLGGAIILGAIAVATWPRRPVALA
ncbi:EamA domain-containing membrane protein RarD [Dongia mobilis]|uniref:EamA domain-containing membrane protein RarD n=1 Tax=Dongia mobilis TaxID=578943 RepID=A0A4R6WJU8_9PROT|nr:DMT family transporter [Dongia mobilis]TDQ80556.1 EamA domain-containing membrane protein RarD [Dongia mobilis]